MVKTLIYERTQIRKTTGILNPTDSQLASRWSGGMGTENLWQKLYEAAILETDPAQLSQRIEAAENAIRERLRELDGQPHSGEERISIGGALSGLKVLKAEKDGRESGFRRTS